MARAWKIIALALLLVAAATLVYRMRLPHPKNNAAENLHPEPILIPGVQKPEEMRVEPFPIYAPSDPERVMIRFIASGWPHRT
jgi:hypothetical protein